MKTLFITGNGFNFMIEDIIREFNTSELTAQQVLTRNDTANNIRAITGLWKKFQKTFDELHQQFTEKGINISDEDLIRLINSVINLFSNIKGFEKILTDEDINKLRFIFDRFLLDKIREIAEEFRQHQKLRHYSKIRNYFPNFANKIEYLLTLNKVDQISIFTTNYDGVLDTLLTKIPNGFLFSDGFINSQKQPDLLELSSTYLRSNSRILCHIHGSYRFTKFFGKTYKTKGNTKNQEPIMVFNNPKVKEEVIKNDNVLSEYFRYLEECLLNFDRLIILGNSMQAEPHIKEAIGKYFHKTKEIICSRNPERITPEIKSYFDGKIIELTTNVIKTEKDLIQLFNLFFDKTISNMSIP